MFQSFLPLSSEVFPGCERHHHIFTNHVAPENFWKVLEQLSKASPASQHKGQVLGLVEVSSPTSGTQLLCLPKATCSKNWNFCFGFIFSLGGWQWACALRCHNKHEGDLNSVKCKKCKKWQLCNLFNLLSLLRSNSRPPRQALPILCWDVLASLWNWEPEISPALLKCSLWKQNNRDTSKSFHLQWKL